MADDQRDLGHPAVADGAHQLGAAADDAGSFGVAADVEAVDVLDEKDRHPGLIALEHEARGLVGTVGVDHAAKLDRTAAFGAEPHALARDDPESVSTEMAKAANERPAVLGAVFVEQAAVENRRQQLAHVVLSRRIGAHQAVKIVGRTARAARSSQRATDCERIWRQQTDQPAQPREAGVVILLVIVDGAADGGMNPGAAQLVVRDFLADGGLHERRPGEVQARSPRS